MCDLQDLINIEMKCKNFPHVSDSNTNSSDDSNAGYFEISEMAPIKKTVNEENNNDVVKFNYGDPSVWFNWICVVCKQKALDGISLEMQYLSDNFFIPTVTVQCGFIVRNAQHLSISTVYNSMQIHNCCKNLG